MTRHRAPRDDRPPREVSRIPARGIVRELRRACETGELRDLRIGMEARETVLVLVERIEHTLVLPALRGIEILPVPRDRINIGQRLVDAAVFLVEHPLHLPVIELRGDADRPVAESDENVLRVRDARKFVRIAQTRHRLVDVVPRHPVLEDDPDIPGSNRRPDFLALRHAVAAPVAVRGLAPLELGNRIREPLAEHAVGILTRRDEIREGAQVMTEGVAVKSAALPVAVRLRLRGKSRLAQERHQQTVDVKLLHIRDIRLHSPAEEALLREPDLRDRVEFDGRRSAGQRHQR